MVVRSVAYHRCGTSFSEGVLGSVDTNELYFYFELTVNLSEKE